MGLGCNFPGSTPNTKREGKRGFGVVRQEGYWKGREEKEKEI